MVKVVFTRPPVGREIQELRKYRLFPDYTADPPVARWELTTPVEMLYVDGALAYEERIGRDARSSDLRQLLEGTGVDSSPAILAAVERLKAEKEAELPR